MEKNTQRNNTVDAIRGIAILLVVFGHTMTGSSEGAEDTLLFNIIWSLQMPLFFLISGFVTKYSSPISTVRSFWRFCKKRTIGYMLPWVIWTFLVRGLVLRQYTFLDIKHLAYHMDSGYWFLFALWVICLVYGLSDFIANKSKKVDFVRVIIYVVCMIGLFALGIAVGMSFLCIKLIVYYMPFFYLGHLFGKYYDRLIALKHGKSFFEIGTACCLVGYFSLIVRFDFYNIDEVIFGIAVRAFTSIMGCAIVCSLVYSLTCNNAKYCQVLSYFGKNSLQIYLIHCMFLSMIRIEETPLFGSLAGFLLCCLNFLITIVCSLLINCVIANNRIINNLCFGRISVSRELKKE